MSDAIPAQRYDDLPPGDRIRKLMEECLEPALSELGFKLMKSTLSFKRRQGDFSQELYVAKSDRNYGNVVVDFWTIWSVSSNAYVKWHKQQYGTAPMNEIVGSWYDRDIPGWKSQFTSGGRYDLVAFDNSKLMDELLSNALRIGIPLLERTSNWQNAADDMCAGKRWGFIAQIFDFYVLANNRQRALQALDEAEAYLRDKAVPPERFAEIALRRQLFG